MDLAAGAGLVKANISQRQVDALLSRLVDGVDELAYSVWPMSRLRSDKWFAEPLGSIFLSWTVKLPRDRAAMEMFKKALDFLNVTRFDYVDQSRFDQNVGEGDDESDQIRKRLQKAVEGAQMSVEILSSEIGSPWIRYERDLIKAKLSIPRVILCLDAGMAQLLVMSPEQERRIIRLDMSDGRPMGGAVSAAKEWMAGAANDIYYRSAKFALRCFDVVWMLRKALSRNLRRPFCQGLALFGKAAARERFIKAIYDDNSIAGSEYVPEQRHIAATVSRMLPDIPPVLNSLAVSLRHVGQSTWAAEILSRLVEMHSEQASLWSNLGSAFRQDGRLDDAVVAFRNSVRLRDADAATLTSLGNVLWLKGATVEAISTLREALRLRPGHPRTLMQLGVALFKHGIPVDAINVLNQIHPGNPEFVTALMAKGRMLEAKGMIEGQLGSLTMVGLQEINDQIRALTTAGMSGTHECLTMIESAMRARASAFMPAPAFIEFVGSFLRASPRVASPG